MLTASVYSRHLAGGNSPGNVEFPRQRMEKEGEMKKGK